MRIIRLSIACAFLVGCATAPVIEENIVVPESIKEEPIKQLTPDITTVPAKEDGIITKLRGVAYIHDSENEEYIVLRPGDRLPIGQVFYLSPKTTMKIIQMSGDEIYLYSKEHEEYYRLERNGP